MWRGYFWGDLEGCLLSRVIGYRKKGKGDIVEFKVLRASPN